MHQLQKLIVTAACAVVTAGIVPSILVKASDCRVENFNYVCKGAGETILQYGVPPGDWYCIDNDEGIGDRCRNAENEPDGGYCVDASIECWWQYWLSCGSGPDSDKGWSHRSVDTSLATGMVGDCGP